MRKSIAAALATATIASGSFMVAAINPFGIASAQDSGTTPTAPAAPTTPAAPSAKSGSNEDPTHDATESATREADEDAGRVGGGHFGGGSNEDPTHEGTESSAREAQEDAGAATTTPAPSTGSTTGASF